MENDIVGENLQKLYEALQSLGSAKLVEDKFMILVDSLKREKDELKREID